MSKVINFFAAPGVGKSVMSAMVFSELKKLGFNTELALEIAREKILDGWDKRQLEDQLSLFASMNRKIWRVVKAEADYVVTDSPLMLSTVYVDDGYFPEHFKNFVLETHCYYSNINIVLERENRPHQMDSGRVHNEEESKLIELKIKEMLKKYEIDYLSVPANDNSIEAILRYAGAIK